jgi:hypothetical protein
LGSAAEEWVEVAPARAGLEVAEAPARAADCGSPAECLEAVAVLAAGREERVEDRGVEEGRAEVDRAAGVVPAKAQVRVLVELEDPAEGQGLGEEADLGVGEEEREVGQAVDLEGGVGREVVVV